ncbi:MAG: transporter substrate-binding domain-containing protein [Eggerthellaceae bacterium]
MSTDEEGRYVGYNIEYLNEIARYADWTYEYVKYPSWEEACAALEASKVDLLPMVYYTEDRERRMIFSASSLCEISTTLNVRLDDTRYAYEDFKTFSGMRVGVIANSQGVKRLRNTARRTAFRRISWPTALPETC